MTLKANYLSICIVVSGDRQVVRDAGPARGGHLASDDHAIRELHSGQHFFSFGGVAGGGEGVGGMFMAALWSISVTDNALSPWMRLRVAL